MIQENHKAFSQWLFSTHALGKLENAFVLVGYKKKSRKEKSMTRIFLSYISPISKIQMGGELCYLWRMPKLHVVAYVTH